MIRYLVQVVAGSDDQLYHGAARGGEDVTYPRSELGDESCSRKRRCQVKSTVSAISFRAALVVYRKYIKTNGITKKSCSLQGR